MKTAAQKRADRNYYAKNRERKIREAIENKRRRRQAAQEARRAEPTDEELDAIALHMMERSTTTK